MSDLISAIDPAKYADRRTKIVATLGPATSSADTIDEMIRAGVNVFRINMSHSNEAQAKQLVARVRKAASKRKKIIAILVDLCGPKIRAGTFEGGKIELKKGEIVTITTRKITGRPGLIPCQYNRLHRDVAIDDRIFIDDGNLELKVLGVDKTNIECRVIYGGTLKDKKGINLPDTKVSAPSLTNKDKADVLVAIDLEADFLALSFVRTGKDVQKLDRYLSKRESTIPIISKIEKPEALENIEDILQHSYGIMVARGDLGIEVDAEKVPLIQDELIKLARSQSKPVIVATQMMESMIQNPRPTRAEVVDVFNAARSSTDAVMLSGETSVGIYPVRTIREMDKILRQIEAYRIAHGQFYSPATTDCGEHSDIPIREAMSNAALSMTRDLGLQAIVVPTRSGITTRVIASRRPLATIIGVCSSEKMARRLALQWGIAPDYANRDLMGNWRNLLMSLSKAHGLKVRGAPVLMIAGFNEDPRLNEPSMKILNIIP